MERESQEQRHEAQETPKRKIQAESQHRTRWQCEEKRVIGEGCARTVQFLSLSPFIIHVQPNCESRCECRVDKRNVLRERE